MTQILFRAIVAGLLAALLAAQAARSTGRNRRRSFATAAVAFALLALANLLTVGSTAIAAALTVAGVALIAASLLFLGLAYRAGELKEQLRRARQMTDEERHKREAAGRGRQDS